LRIWDLDTPALLVDLDIVEKNIRRAADYASHYGLRIRPHTKTHKVPELARLQLDAGAAGLTVAKVGEAEVMAEVNPPQLLVAYPIIGADKLQRLVKITRRLKVTVALDSLEAAARLSSAASSASVRFGVLAELNVGMNRVGVNPGAELRDLARGIARLPALDFEGIAFYAGHIRRLDAEGLRALDSLGRLVRTAIADLRRDGFEVPVVSGGSTLTLFHSHLVDGMNEIRPGTYIFNDRNTLALGGCSLSDCAASMLVTIVSTARPGQAIIDGGSKTFSSDRLAGAGEEAGYGLVLEDHSIRFHRMSEEHGFLDLRACSRPLRIGDRLRIIPNHICTAVNLHDTLYGVRGEEVVVEWKIRARGCIR